MEYHLVVLLGLKAVATAVGMVILVTSLWWADRAYDDDDDEVVVDDDASNGGGTTSTPHTKTAYHTMMPADDSPPPSSSAYQQQQQPPFWKQITLRGDVMDVFQSSTTAGRYRKYSLLGWLILMFACFLDRTTYGSGFKTKTETTTTNILLMLLFLVLAVMHTILLPKAVALHQVGQHQTLLLSSLTALYGLTALVLSRNNLDAPLWMPVVGAVGLAVSPVILWHERKRGAAYEQQQQQQQQQNAHGKTTTRKLPVAVFGWGGPALVIGWTAWWFALNVTHAHPDRWYLPLYFHAGAYMAWAGAAVVLIVTWMAGYAIDLWRSRCNNNNATNIMQDLESTEDDIPALGMCGRTLDMVHVTDVKFVFMAAWAVWSLAPLLPYTVGYAPWFLSILTLTQGILWCVIYEQAILTGNVIQLSLYSKIAAVFALWWWVQLTVTTFHQQHGIVSVVALTGVVLLVTGLYYLLQDQQAQIVMEATTAAGKPTQQSQHVMVVYSNGAILVPAGMCCLAYAMSCV